MFKLGIRMDDGSIADQVTLEGDDSFTTYPLLDRC